MKHESLSGLLDRHFAAAIGGITGAAPEVVDAAVRPSADARFGDFQCNAAMGLSKKLGVKPREVAERIVAAVSGGLTDIAEPLQIAGPGFINIRIKASHLAAWLAEIPPPPKHAIDFSAWILESERRRAASKTGATTPDAAGEPDRLGIPPAEGAERVVVDYSSPNVAKQMHVGHLRSTAIGDALVRVLTFAGHEVIRQNHIGDWGTSLGMAILGLWYVESRVRRGESLPTIDARIRELTEIRAEPPERRKQILSKLCDEWSEDVVNAELNRFADAPITIEQLESGYVFVQTLLSVAAGLELRAYGDELTTIPQKVTKMLQTGGEENEPERRAWERILKTSLDHCQDIYARLGALLQPGDIRGESFYNPMLGTTVIDLQQTFRPRDKNQPADGPYAEVRTDKGATCIFFYDDKHQPLYRTQDGSEFPMIIQKSDGAFLYATTDLAAVRFRIQELRAGRILYVVGAPTKLHLEMLFAAALLAGWLRGGVTLRHVSFGQVLGEDRKLLRTRTGGAVKLKSLLEEAETRARDELDKKLAQESAEYRDSFTEDEKREIAQRVGTGSVKYFDLARDLNSDYVFNWSTMLAMQGNTAPYLLYAYTRIRSMLRDAATQGGPADLYAAGTPVRLDAPTERGLAMQLARLPGAIDAVVRELSPHILCNFLYDLAVEFMRFYEACPVLKAPDAATRASRLRLCDLTARALRLGLSLLGISVVERM